MKIMIIGGTGFLGYYATLDALKKGHEVATMAIPDVPIESWYPKQVKVTMGDIFAMKEDEVIKLLRGFDALIYAVGPDDRYIPKAPAYDFFHARLVESCGRVIMCARKAGLKACTVCNSYFAYFDRTWPKAQLAAHHAYIRCRVEQAERCLKEAGETMKVSILELPYIFGVMPERMPLWKDVLFERLKKMNPVIYTTGGTTMITAEHVGEALVGAVVNGAHGRFPIGDVNMTWKEMLTIMLNAMGVKRKILTLPKWLTWIAAFYGKSEKKKDAAQGKESGLDHDKVFQDIMCQFMYLDPTESVKALGYNRGGVKEAIEETVYRCYPELKKSN